MKLNQLKIQAFGPFAGEETIDFLALGENPLFLIDGATGAGKSSILHAICYALYGETTDSERKDFGLRCDHTAGDVLTELMLEFCIRGETYRITRQPTQMRPNKRADGETEQQATAHLCRVLSDGSEETLVAKKNKDADEHIKTIVGLSKEQFRQVMVLPQGKFRELLLAKSNERQVILSTLFQTEIYKRIEQLLKDESAAIERDYNKFQEKINEALSDAEVANFDELLTEINEAQNSLNHQTNEKVITENAKQNAQRELENAETLEKEFFKLATTQQQFEQLDTQTDVIQTQKTQLNRANQAASIVHMKTALDELQNDISTKETAKSNALKTLEIAEKQFETTKNDLQKVEQDYQQRDDFKQQESQLQSYQIRLTNCDLLKDAAKKAADSYQKVILKRDKFAKKLSDLDAMLANQQIEITNFEKLIGDKTAISCAEIEAKAKLEKRNSLEKAQTALTKLNKELTVAEKAFALADIDYKQAVDQANRIEMQWFKNRAAELAAKLEIGQPCSVCGSTAHPNLAKFDSDSADITKETVDEARENEAKLLTLKNEADKKSALAQQKITQKTEEIQMFTAELGDSVNSSISDLKANLETLTTQLKTITETEDLLAKTKETFAENQASHKSLIAELKALEEQVISELEQNTTAKNKLDNAENDLPEMYRNSAVVEKEFEAIQQKIKTLETTYSSAQKAQEKAVTNLSSAQTSVTNAENLLVELKTRHDEQTENWQQVLMSNAFESIDAFQAALLDKTAFKELKSAIENYETKYSELKIELRVLNEQLADKTLPDLENLKTNQVTADNVYREIETLCTAANQKLVNLKTTQKKITELESQQGEIKSQYEIIGELSKAASGNGNKRVSLERFVLGSLLDTVLDIASKRLQIMSKGQYQLIRQNEENQKKNTTAGLDLAVHDANTGKVRPVATLSGGESFMASLALALALSDVVQQRSGGIQLDTLFIDEGFGSLDQESLQLAIQTLIDLQSTGRTIGIISHVSELKDQMKRRIAVVGSRSGSKIKIVV
jgi:exonuclease SbcC